MIMHSKTCTLKYPQVIVGLVFITCTWVYLGSQDLYLHELQLKKYRLDSIILTANSNAREVPDESTFKIRRSTKDDLMKIFRHAGQLQYALRHLLQLVKNGRPENDMESIIKKVKKYQFPLTTDIFYTIQQIIQNDNQDLKQLQEIVSNRIIRLQNPTDCSQARKLICHLNVHLGIGCVLHHLSECFLVALGTNRTMITNISGVRYKGWKKPFLPLSSCDDSDDPVENVTFFLGELSRKPTQNHVPIVKKVAIGPHSKPNTKFRPFAIPTLIAGKLLRAHNDPKSWWIGQLYSYLMRLRPSILEVINKTKKEIGFSHPIVCVHVRRKEKIRETPHHNLSDYMVYVNKWYEEYELRTNPTRKIERKVYLATDEYRVIEEAKTIYTSFKFLHDPLIQRHAVMNNRFTEEGLLYILLDITLLSQCDFFVGTLTSNVGRSVYELMQSKSERTFDAISLDITYCNHRGYPHWHEAITEHYPQGGDIELKVGDKIQVQKAPSDFHVGYGMNERTRKKGTYPMIKVKHSLPVENFAAL